MPSAVHHHLPRRRGDREGTEDGPESVEDGVPLPPTVLVVPMQTNSEGECPGMLSELKVSQWGGQLAAVGGARPKRSWSGRSA